MWRRHRATAETTAPAQRLSDELGLLEQIHAQGGEICFGAPSRCPDCGAMGIVDELHGGRQVNGCLRCGARWTFSAKAVALFDDAHQPADQPEVVGMGVLVADLSGDGSWAHVTRERFIGMSRAVEQPLRPRD